MSLLILGGELILGGLDELEAFRDVDDVVFDACFEEGTDVVYCGEIFEKGDVVKERLIIFIFIP